MAETAKKLSIIYKKLSYDSYDYTSNHLKPFVHQLVSKIDCPLSWQRHREDLLDSKRKKMQQQSGIDSSIFLAHRMHSVISCMLQYVNIEDIDVLNFISEACQEYEMFTAGRHYRLALLQRLHNVLAFPENHILVSPNETKLFCSNNSHIGIPLAQVTAVGLCQDEIVRFSFTLQDAKHDFSHVPLSLGGGNDSVFIEYLKQRDSMMAVWIDSGLITLNLGYPV
jgi:hypothetical protein